jgi:hypothetical protein
MYVCFGLCPPIVDIPLPYWKHDEYLALQNLDEMKPFLGLSGMLVKPRVRVKMGRAVN